MNGERQWWLSTILYISAANYNRKHLENSEIGLKNSWIFFLPVSVSLIINWWWSWGSAVVVIVTAPVCVCVVRTVEIIGPYSLCRHHRASVVTYHRRVPSACVTWRRRRPAVMCCSCRVVDMDCCTETAYRWSPELAWLIEMNSAGFDLR